MAKFSSLQIKPMFAEPGEPFDHDDYIYEVKWDGYRAVAYLNEETRLVSRNLKDFTFNYPNLLDLHKKVKSKPTVLDGEIITLEGGRPNFQKLQRGKEKPTIFIAFDILYNQGESVMNLPLNERKELLHKTVIEDNNFLISKYIRKEGKEFFKNCIAKGLEGVVAKDINSTYIPGRRVSHWKKIKGIKEEDFVIAGYLPGKGSLIGSLALGVYEEKELVFRGLVGTGLSEKLKQLLLELFAEIKLDRNPFNNWFPELEKSSFVIPHFVCRVKYLEVTKDGRLRHPSFCELRVDKFAKDLLEEKS